MLANVLYLFPARNMKVIAVTGTDGKTTTVSYIASILEAAGYKVGVTSSAYYRIGDKEIVNNSNHTVVNPFELMHLLFKMRLKRVDWVVMEVTAHSLVQNRVYGVPFAAAVMTNLTHDHLDYFGNMHDYAAAKARLFQKKPPIIVLNRDDDWFDYYDAFPATQHKMTFGTGAKATCRIIKAKLGTKESTFDVVVDTVNRLSLRTNMIGKHNVYNAAAAIAVSYLLHIDQKAIAKGIADLDFIAGRTEFVDAGQDFSVVIDYAHTPAALNAILETMRGTTTSRLILVFGATGDRDRLKRPDMGEIAAKYVDRIYVTDEEPYDEDPEQIRQEIMAGIRKGRGLGKTEEVADREEAIRTAVAWAKTGDTIVITGMGHQESMVVGGQKVPWSDVGVAKKAIADKIKTAS